MIIYTATSNNIHIHNSYLVVDDDIKRVCINELLEKEKELCKHRTAKSLFYEWKTHNIFHQHGWWVERTADVDFEFHQKWHYKVAYWLIAHLMREKVL